MWLNENQRGYYLNYRLIETQLIYKSIAIKILCKGQALLNLLTNFTL